MTSDDSSNNWTIYAKEKGRTISLSNFGSIRNAKWIANKYYQMMWDLNSNTEIFKNRESNRSCMSFGKEIKGLKIDVYKTTKYSLKDHEEGG